MHAKDKNGRYIQAVDIPQELYQSIKGKYFVGYADELSFGGAGPMHGPGSIILQTLESIFMSMYGRFPMWSILPSVLNSGSMPIRRGHQSILN